MIFPMQFLKINKKLLPVKFHFFLFSAGLACALPFRSIFAKQLGISATAVGVIFSAIPFLKIITNPLFGFILDYFKRFRLTISVTIAIVAVSHMAMIFIPAKVALPLNGNSGINFNSKIGYSCLTDSEKEEHNIIMYSMWNNLLNESNYMCDINCAKISEENKQHTKYCANDLSFQFKIEIHVENCNTDIDLNSGTIYSIRDNNRMEVAYINNASSISHIELKDILHKQNFSEESNLPSKISSIIKFNNVTKEDFSGYSNITNIINEHNGSQLTLAYSNNDKRTKCYNLQGYKIKLKYKHSNISCLCESEFKCKTEYCSKKSPKDEVNSEKLISTENEFLSVQFWSLFILFSVSSVTLCAVMFTTDTACYEILQEKGEKYGEQRLWGTVGWGVGALVGGYLNQLISCDSEEVNYAPSFILLCGLLLIDIIPVYQLKVTDPAFSSHIWKDVCSLLSKFKIVYNIIVVYTIGALSGFIWNYQFWFMEEIGSSQVLLGLSQTVECIVAEVPCFLASGWIIKKIGYAHCNSVTLLCFGLRYLCFAFMYDPWMTLPVGLLHGPTFGIFYASMTAYAKQEAPPGTEATVQSLLNLSFEGLGVASGCLLGGMGIDKFGSRTTFMYIALISFILLLINIITSIIFSRFSKKIEQSKDLSK